ncbi:MAG: ATP-binding protein [Dysgonomonas sp.]|nr:ATP-binding protein [Dysgonomonas sp.]
MFKSIEYKLILYTGLLIASVALATFLLLTGKYVYGGFFVFVVLYSINRLYKHYGKYNQNILFLLNALDNGDYSFNFAETQLSRREKELNQMMNRIKEILAKARKEVIENEKFLSLIVESVSTGIIILNENNNIIITNRATNQLLGLPVFTHIKQLNVIDKSYPELFSSIKPNENKTIKVTNEREEIQISLRSSTIKLKKGMMKVITLNSIGNELEAKEMESWIKLIRVMTHEIMNSIAPITSLTDTILFSYSTTQSEKPDNQLEQDTIDALQTISSTAKGLISFVESYRKFTGVPKPQLNQFSLDTLIGQVVSLQSQNIKNSDIDFEIIPANEPITVNADESQITQVLVNLVKNAIEAIPSDKDGKIVIKTMFKDNKIQVDVCNNGQSIPEEIVPNIFIPFFTTKQSGSGIGLSVSRYIMRLHGGNLKHHTNDNWTVFSMVF